MDDKKEKIKKLVFEYVGSKTKHNFIPGETNIPPSGKVIDHNEVWNIVDSASFHGCRDPWTNLLNG